MKDPLFIFLAFITALAIIAVTLLLYFGTSGIDHQSEGYGLFM